MRLSLATKIAGLLVLSIGIAGFTVMVTAVTYLNKPFLAQNEASIQRMQAVISKQSRDTEKRFYDLAALTAKDTALVQAVVDRNTPAAAALGKQLMKETGSDFITITDEKGIVVARGHSAKFGDDVNNQETVQFAREGKTAVGIVSGTEVPFTIRAGAPLKVDGKVVGTVGIGQSLVTEGYVDELKKTTGLDITYFKGDTRVMTTIERDGKRAIGTPIDDPQVRSEVLGQGRTLFNKTHILGVEYEAAYWPVHDMHGKVVGMVFAGLPLSEVLAIQRVAMQQTFIGFLAVTILFTIISIFFGRLMARPIKRTTDYAVSVAGGHLDATLDVHGRDEVGTLADALRAMVDTLRARIHEANEQSARAAEEAQAAQVATRMAEEATKRAESAKKEGMLQAAAELEGIVNGLSSAAEDMNGQIQTTMHGTRSQSQRVSETMVSMSEMSTAVLDVARAAANAAERSSDARHNAQDGANVVVRLGDDIGKLQTQSLQLNKDMDELGQRAESIGRIMSVITDIADQTNLLALNAAIEAARAGEAGRGFAVVADEVRKLAEKTMQATREVGDAVTGIQGSARKNADQLAETTRQVEGASAKAQEAEAALRAIVELAEQTAEQVRSMAAASEEQSASAEHVTRALDEMNQGSAEISSTMENAARAVDSMSAQAHSLADLIHRLQKENA